jgi:hypothetical protein
MDMGGYNWRDEHEIRRWMVDWREHFANGGLSVVGEADPADELRKRLNRGDVAGENKRSIEAFFKVEQEKSYKISEQAKADRDERAVNAAERSAKWAGWALLISIAALSISAWAPIRP